MGNIDIDETMSKSLEDVSDALHFSNCAIFTEPTGVGKSAKLPRFLTETDGNFFLKLSIINRGEWLR